MYNFKIGEKVVCEFVHEWDKQLTVGNTYKICGTSQEQIGDSIIHKVKVVSDVNEVYETSPISFGNIEN